VRGAAEVLICHPNTVRHRLRRIVKHTGRSLQRPKDVAELCLAFEVHRRLMYLRDRLARFPHDPDRAFPELPIEISPFHRRSLPQSDVSTVRGEAQDCWSRAAPASMPQARSVGGGRLWKK
jgi:hypothetical protein